MITVTSAVSFFIGGTVVYSALKVRAKQQLHRKITEESTRCTLALDLLENDLKYKHRRSLKQLSKRADQSKRRDERKSAEQKHDEQLLIQQESLLSERAIRQEERSENLAIKGDENQQRKQLVKNLKFELRTLKDHSFEKLEERAETTKEALSEQMKSTLYAQVEIEAQRASQQHLVQAEAYASQHASQLLSLSCQRYYDPRPADRLLNYVQLPNSNKKREALLDEGRSLIEALSEITGVEFYFEPHLEDRLLLRNAPESFTKEVARTTFDRWVQGGQLTEAMLRTHHQKSLNLLEKRCREGGLAAAKRLGLKGIHSEILYLVGKLLYRTSYTQNQWTHAIEAAEICGMMAEELGIDPLLARRATLLHDIGKVLWDETEEVGSHAVSGATFAKEHGELPEVIHPIAAHHHDETPSSALAFLVIAADTLSGARPGARRETSEAFSQHVEQLEEICSQIPHVRHHMIIQGGREVRLQLQEQRYTDLEVARLTEELAQNIEDECIFPGQVKVTALRQIITSATAYALRHSDHPQDQINTITRLNERLSGKAWRGGEVLR